MSGGENGAPVFDTQPIDLALAEGVQFEGISQTSAAHSVGGVHSRVAFTANRCLSLIAYAVYLFLEEGIVPIVANDAVFEGRCSGKYTGMARACVGGYIVEMCVAKFRSFSSQPFESFRAEERPKTVEVVGTHLIDHDTYDQTRFRLSKASQAHAQDNKKDMDLFHGDS